MIKKIFWFVLLLGSAAWVWLLQQSSFQFYVEQTYLPPIVTSMSLNHDLTDYFLDHPQLEKTVNNWYESLSPKARVAQLIMPAWDGETSIEELEALINKNVVGGFMVLRKDFSPADITRLKAANTTNGPLLVSVDAEPSLLKYRFKEDVFEGETADLKTEEQIITVGKEILSLLQGYGINLNFAPVYDVGVNKTVIGTRAFSYMPTEAAAQANILSDLWIKNNLIPTAKHFPGHGTVVGDTHKSLQTIKGKLIELLQFRRAILANVPVIMAGHIAVEGPFYDTQGLPATLSALMLQDVLRESLNFKGVVITDAMNMKAVSEIEDASLKALQAGSDIVLMPNNPTALNEQVLSLMQTDRAFANDVEAKVKRVLRLKLVWQISENYEN